MTLTSFFTLTGAAVLLTSGAMAQTPLPAEVKVPNETAPPGGTVQLKLELTEPRPIMTGTTKFDMDPAAMDGLFGISVYSPAGDAFGVALLQNGKFSANYVSPLQSLGTFVDYPIVTVTAHVPATTPVGWQSRIMLAGGSGYTNVLGQNVAFVENRAGLLTVGGVLMVHNVVPGGGVWPAGTLVKILGAGFSKGTKLQTKLKTRSVQFISANEIDVILDRPTQMDSQMINLENPDKAQVTYYSYLRGIDSGASSNPLIAAVDPIFPLVTQSRVMVGQSQGGINGTVETALAIQNPNPQAVTVQLTTSGSSGSTLTNTVTLNFGERITRSLSEFLGAALPGGAVVRVISSAPVQLVPFTADSATSVLTPFAPQVF